MLSAEAGLAVKAKEEAQLPGHLSGPQGALAELECGGHLKPRRFVGRLELMIGIVGGETEGGAGGEEGAGANEPLKEREGVVDPGRGIVAGLRG